MKHDGEIAVLCKLLDTYQIGRKTDRMGLATKIRQDGGAMSAKTLELLLMHFSDQPSPTEAVRVSITMGTWQKLSRELYGKASAKDRNLDEAGSSIFEVRNGNPYGWHNPDPIREFYDHNDPGLWNPYRQCYNLGIDEVDPNDPDFRRHGCSRYEVVYPTDDGNAVPKTRYDQAEVTAAQNAARAERMQGLGHRSEQVAPKPDHAGLVAERKAQLDRFLRAIGKNRKPGGGA